jgi:hypothetical protein
VVVRIGEFIMIDWSKYKPAKKGGAQKAAEIFESTRKKQPSDRLVQIISEVQPDLTPERDKEEQKKRDDKVARSPEV